MQGTESEGMSVPLSETQLVALERDARAALARGARHMAYEVIALVAEVRRLRAGIRRANFCWCDPAGLGPGKHDLYDADDMCVRCLGDRAEGGPRG